jgi:radical SAM superfamily enzyme YgiQ (UPF0313 family)
MKIALVMPAGAIHRCRSGSFKKTLRYAPLTLTTLAALVPSDLHAEIQLIDEGVQQIPNEIEADIVGITAITGTAPRAYEIADRLRKHKIPVVLGGVHPTLMPEEAAEHADAVVVGYAEETWPQLLRDFQNSRMQPLYRSEVPKTLDHLPVARRDLLRKNTYVTVNSIYATRGCPNSCQFCVIPIAWGKRTAFRPIPEVIAEIEQLDGRDLVLIDPNLTSDPQYARQLFEALAPLKKRWFGLATTEIVEGELLTLAAKSGCRGIFMGFESVTQSTLDGIDKSFNVANKYRDLVNRVHDHGIAIQGAFVFGFDSDDPSVFEQTVEAVDKLNIDLPRFSIFTPFPGTPIYNKLNSEGRIIERNWSLYDAQHVVFKPAKMTPTELQEGLHDAWRQTYRTGSILKRVVASRCTPLVNIAANIGYKYYAAKLPRFDRNAMMDMQDLSHL